MKHAHARLHAPSRLRLRRNALVAATLGLLALPACGGSTSSSTAAPGTATASAQAATSNPYNPVYGFHVGLYQTMDESKPVSDAHIEQLLGILAGRTKWVRLFGTNGPASRAAHLAHQRGFKVALGAWLSNDPAGNGVEVAGLLKAVDAGDVDLAIVGSETIHNKFLNETQLLSYIREVRDHVGGRVPVTTVEPDKEMLQNATLVSAEDAVMVNIPPISYGVTIDHSLDYVKNMYAQLVSIAHGKPVIIGETEWPSGHTGGGWDMATPENAARYFSDIEGWARQENVPLFYFEAFDEPWLGKSNAVGGYWGVWTSDLQLKPGMEKVFQR